jgi:alpha-beta hydrolase superfamily lysophospholipase
MSTTETLQARDGTQLLVRRWEATGDPWATALIVHGLGEHSGRWEAVGARFAASGIATESYDHRGHGASQGRRAHVERWTDLLDDVDDRLAASRRPGLPAILYGQSMGGLIVSDDLLDPARPAPDLAVLSAPALGDRLSPLLRALVPVVARVAPTLAVANPFAPAQLSRDPAVGVAYAADPLTTSKTTTRLGRSILDAARRVNARVAAGERFPCPVLVIHGDADAIVPTGSTAALADVPGVERRALPGVLHEPHNDPAGDAIVGDVIAWLRARVGAGA